MKQIKERLETILADKIRALLFLLKHSSSGNFYADICRVGQLAFPFWVALDDWTEEQFVQAVVRGDKRGWEGDGERVWLDYWLFFMWYVWVSQKTIRKLFSQGNSSVYNTRDMGPSATLKWLPSPQSSRLSRRYWEPQLKKHSNLMINWWTL